MLRLASPRTRILVLALAVTAALAMAAAACGSEKVVVQTVVVEKPVEKVVVQTVVVEKPVEKVVVQTVVVEKPVEKVVVQTVVVEKQVVVEKPGQILTVVATATPAAPKNLSRPEPNSILKVAVTDVGSPNFLSPRAVNPNDNRNHVMSVFETLLIEEGKQGAIVNVAVTEWELKGLVFRAKLDPTMQFHYGWGSVTAEDVAYSWTRTAEQGAVNSAATTIRNEWASWRAVDGLTFEATLKVPNVNFRRALVFGTYIHSKKAIDKNGDDWADKNAIGTGPYRLAGIVADTSITLEAVPKHYRETAWFETVKLYEVPDPNIRIAQMRTGEVDLMKVGIPQVPQVQGIPGVRLQTSPNTGRAGTTIFFGGQYYVGPKTSSWDPQYAGHKTEGLERKLNLDLPWVGDFRNDPADNQKAILVRRAMTMAIDKKLINEKILAGKGCPGPMYGADECHPRWDKKLNVDYDPVKAKQLLSDAGYPNGFTFPVWIPEQGDTFVEVSEAMVSFWANIGLKPTVQKTAYTARRPKILSREMAEVWFMSHGTGVLPYGGVFQWAELNGRGVWGQNIEYDKMGQLADKMFAAVGNVDLQWTIQREYWDFHFENQLTGGGIFWNDGWALGPRVGSWDAQYESTGGIIPPQLERAIPAAR